MNPEEITKRLAALAGPIAAIGVILATLADLKTKWLDIFSNPLEWTWRQYVFFSVAVLIVVILHLWSRRGWVSTLIDPDALRLDLKTPEHPVGRAEDLELLNKAIDHPLVFLVGEFGSGKSALLRAGLTNHTETRQRFIPIYLDLSDLDWERGALQALTQAVWLQLTDQQRSKMGISELPVPGKLLAGINLVQH